VAGREVAVKKYVVRLSAKERERLEDLRSKGTIPARRLLKVQILLKADVSEAGDGWSDSKIMKAFDTTDTMVYTVRKKLVEEGLDAVLSRKRRETPPVARIFDGEREAELIALACSEPPPGFARWTLRLLEEKVVELQIVDRASDSTIGRVLKKHPQAPYQKVLGDSARGERRFCRSDGGCSGGLQATARSQATSGLSRRDVKATDFRDAHADSNEARERGPL
jgi:hypothetical protein